MPGSEGPGWGPIRGGTRGLGFAGARQRRAAGNGSRGELEMGEARPEGLQLRGRRKPVGPPQSRCGPSAAPRRGRSGEKLETLAYPRPMASPTPLRGSLCCPPGPGRNRCDPLPDRCDTLSGRRGAGCECEVSDEDSVVGTDRTERRRGGAVSIIGSGGGGLAWLTSCIVKVTTTSPLSARRGWRVSIGDQPEVLVDRWTTTVE